jgi:hypothetical protein
MRDPYHSCDNYTVIPVKRREGYPSANPGGTTGKKDDQYFFRSVIIQKIPRAARAESGKTGVCNDEVTG